METKYQGIVVDVINRRQFKGEVIVKNGKIDSIRACEHECTNYILPGFVDAHVHIESSMTVPSSFARMVVSRGTVAVVSDPHEIANVMGVEGIDFMIENARSVPLKIYFGVPSCVPATPFESAGCILDETEVDRLLARNDLYFLSEMMNFPGVIYGFPDVMSKIESARKYNKLIDGHAPGLRGDDLKKYVKAGISTDHECFSYDEAVEKIQMGMNILIREGSAAKNFDELYPLIDEYPDQVMLCTDDSHPDTLLEEGHIDKLIKKGLEKGVNLYNLLKAAVVNPVNHYKLNVGLLQKGDPADFIIVEDLKNFKLLQTIIDGIPVYGNSEVLFAETKSKTINVFNRKKINTDDLKLETKPGRIRVITVTDGELITGQELHEPLVKNGSLVSDTDRDILKLVVMSRYKNEPVQVGFIKNIGLKKGAIASSIAHDSHNIIAVGVSDADIVSVVNKLIENKGGIVVGDADEQLALELEIAGLMTRKKGEEVAALYNQLIVRSREFGSRLSSPFMTIAFMSLLVIPKLKLGDKGLFDVDKFDFVEVFVKE
ncbi:MAG: adenine deaminase [Bacteroidetes bacterium GWF2_42_66]|nr:MAG: adenine deaminase [Bacteroidetes bacterium GWA2_42_15]OFX97957.1 MAG: adenine deaminase [Bacteroidetes bacterium GWE2_42_39]OFY45806.1 MAG: adenine deaminase [Bacteroidetes bacterium GWF2_42_66]HBL74694.1 adenine deaminase [Prolixibacteraceae bacterium]HCR89431.1 adenine deaminase [Prolixibacteraceae bacterium]